MSNIDMWELRGWLVMIWGLVMQGVNAAPGWLKVMAVIIAALYSFWAFFVVPYRKQKAPTQHTGK